MTKIFSSPYAVGPGEMVDYTNAGYLPTEDHNGKYISFSCEILETYLGYDELGNPKVYFWGTHEECVEQTDALERLQILKSVSASEFKGESPFHDESDLSDRLIASAEAGTIRFKWIH